MNPIAFAATTQQRLGVAFVVALVVGWAAFLVLSVRRSGEEPGDESVTAPNRRPYFDDETMEGPRLERAQLWAVILLFVTVLGLFVYWMDEPSRQAGAAVGFEKRAAHRGFVLFQPTSSNIPEGNIGHFGCGGCHGAKGEGGVTPFAMTDELGRSRTVKWAAPSLDDVLLRFDEDEVRTIITYGRANTPMPPWGVEGGGPMNTQQVDDLIAYMKTIQLKPDEARARALKNAADNGWDPNSGADLFDNYCSRCHTKGWSYGEPEIVGAGAYGPNLTSRSTISQFPLIDKHIELVTDGSQFKKPYGTRGEGSGRMPAFGLLLTEAQIRAIVEYERSL